MESSYRVSTTMHNSSYMDDYVYVHSPSVSGEPTYHTVHRVKSPQERASQQLRRRKPVRREWPHTSGRFLFDESQTRAERSIRFDVLALEREVSRCMNDRRVLSTTTYYEGDSSRFLLITLEHSREVIVKIPYRPCPQHYATASEVATLSYLRSNGITVPKVFDWSSRAAENNVGVEYIIMEKATGISAAACLSNIAKPDIEQLVRTYVDIEKYLFGLKFSAYGSLYFKDDVAAEHQIHLSGAGITDANATTDRFCVGPTTDPIFWSDGATTITADHGPWRAPSAFLESLGRVTSRQMANIRQPISNKFPYNSLFESQTDPADQLQLLQQYQTIAPFLLHSDADASLLRPVLRHPDLTAQTLHISPEQFYTTSLVQWRHATITPFGTSAGFPAMFDSPSSPSGAFLSARSPPNFSAAATANLPSPCNTNSPTSDSICSASPQPSDRQAQLLHYFYRIHTSLHNKLHATVLDTLPVQLLQRLLYALRAPWAGVRNLILLKSALVSLSQHWQEFAGAKNSSVPKCPLHYDRQELDDQAYDEELLHDAEELVRYLHREIFGITARQDGWVSKDDYERARRRNMELKEEWLVQAGNLAEEKQISSGWMFQDDGDDDNNFDVVSASCDW